MKVGLSREGIAGITAGMVCFVHHSGLLVLIRVATGMR